MAVNPQIGSYAHTHNYSQQTDLERLLTGDLLLLPELGVR
jgi:hypothetical protein